MKSFFNRLVVLICKSVALLPFWAIYILSDVMYFIVYHLISYRKKVVLENLTHSLPEKSPQEINTIMKKFYRHLCDVSLETLKYSRMTEHDVDERVKMSGMEIFEEYYNQGKSVILLTMHYNNWEWLGAMQRFMKPQFSYVYNNMRSNPEFEDFMLKTRVHLGGKSVPIGHSVRTALSFANSAKPQGLMLVADQTSPSNSQFWTTFLNQETAFFSGPMKIAAKTNQPVILLHIKKTSRGHYEFCNSKLIENPSAVEPEEILLAYVRSIEAIIKAEPEYWLWSHRRWKHKRPENIPLK
jgi:KDO2-lipid IV(A) lauroyltransferase